MISIIICSRHSTISKSLKENISNTVQVNYELVIVENSENKYSIFEAYNEGIRRSSGKILAFIHDDILFHNEGWGAILEMYFKTDPDLGLVGIAGNSIKTKMPTSWWTGPGKNYVRLIQHREGAAIDRDEGFKKRGLTEVAVIDGVFMAMRADKRISLDPNQKGFHTYDLELSLQNQLLKKKVCVTNEILIEHFSGGSINKSWYLATSNFHRINSRRLPIIRSEVLKHDLKKSEFSSGAGFIWSLLENDMKKEAFYWWIRLMKVKLLAKFHFKFIAAVFLK